MKPGAGAAVFLVEHVESKERGVLKLSFVKVDEKYQFEEQMDFWKDLNVKSKDIVILKEYFFNNQNACIIMEFCEEEIMMILIPVMRGLKAMHWSNVIHRDVKASNILICKGMIIKLADFNVSRRIEGKAALASTMAGSILHSTPEMLKNESYSFPVDVYSVGVVLYELMTLTSPFTSVEKILAGEYLGIDAKLGYSTNIVELTRKILSIDPSERPTATEVLELPFIIQAEANIVRMEVIQKMMEEKNRSEEQMAVMERKIAQLEQLVMKRDEEEGDCYWPAYALRTLPGSAKTSMVLVQGYETVMVALDHHFSSDRIYILDIILTGNHALGLALKSAVPSLISKIIYQANGACAFTQCDLFIEKRNPVSKPQGTHWNIHSPTPTTVRLEYSTAMHALHCFVDGRPLPYCVSDLPEDVCFAISSDVHPGTLDVCSLRSVRSTVASHGSRCEKNSWRA